MPLGTDRPHNILNDIEGLCFKVIRHCGKLRKRLEVREITPRRNSGGQLYVIDVVLRANGCKSLKELIHVGNRHQILQMDTVVPGRTREAERLYGVHPNRNK